MAVSTLALVGASYALDKALDASSQENEVKKLGDLAPSKVRRVLTLARAVTGYFYRTKPQENHVKPALDAAIAVLDIPLTLSPEFGIPQVYSRSEKSLFRYPPFLRIIRKKCD